MPQIEYDTCASFQGSRMATCHPHSPRIPEEVAARALDALVLLVDRPVETGDAFAGYRECVHAAAEQVTTGAN